MIVARGLVFVRIANFDSLSCPMVAGFFNFLHPTPPFAGEKATSRQPMLIKPQQQLPQWGHCPADDRIEAKVLQNLLSSIVVNRDFKP